MKVKLKPCPFCGGNATLKYAPGFGWEQPPDTSMAAINCRSCNLFGSYANTDKAIAAWNKRVPIPISSTSSLNENPSLHERIVGVISSYICDVNWSPRGLASEVIAAVAECTIEEIT